MEHNILAIIPARGGSKGIPRKNIRSLRGKPLIAYTIEQALSSENITRIIVSTDDAEIAMVARQYEAEVMMRPQELATDTASTEPVLLHVLSVLEYKEGYIPSFVVLLQPTSPLRQTDDIDRAINTLIAANADSLFSCCRSHNFYWQLLKDQLGSINYDYMHRPRRQDMVPEYIENGSIYVTKTEILQQYENRLGGCISFYEMDFLDSFQIDTEEDFFLIEQILNMQKHRRALSKLKGVRLLVLDFDGVMTDNRVLVSENGTEYVLCHRGDGLGIEMVKQANIPVVVISKESNPVVMARCKKLNIICYQNKTDKLTILKQVAEENSIDLDKVAYMGNDVNDIECLKAAGIAIAVADAHQKVIEVSDIVTHNAGGKGALREICDLILESKTTL